MARIPDLHVHHLVDGMSIFGHLLPIQNQPPTPSANPSLPTPSYRRHSSSPLPLYLVARSRSRLPHSRPWTQSPQSSTIQGAAFRTLLKFYASPVAPSPASTSTPPPVESLSSTSATVCLRRQAHAPSAHSGPQQAPTLFIFVAHTCPHQAHVRMSAPGADLQPHDAGSARSVLVSDRPRPCSVSTAGTSTVRSCAPLPSLTVEPCSDHVQSGLWRKLIFSSSG
jgi:hypothetical protein